MVWNIIKNSNLQSIEFVYYAEVDNFDNILKYNSIKYINDIKQDYKIKKVLLTIIPFFNYTSFEPDLIKTLFNWREFYQNILSLMIRSATNSKPYSCRACSISSFAEAKVEVTEGMFFALARFTAKSRHLR